MNNDEFLMKIDEIFMKIDENRNNSLTNEGPMGLHLRQHTQEPRGPRGFSDLGKINVKLCPGIDWGEIGTPKGFLGTVQTISLANKSRQPRGVQMPPQRSAFRAPVWAPKGPQGLLGPRHGLAPSKMRSGAEHNKVGE